MSLSCAGGVLCRRVVLSPCPKGEPVRNLHMTAVCRKQKHIGDQIGTRSVGSAIPAVQTQEGAALREGASEQREQAGATRGEEAKMRRRWDAATMAAIRTAVLAEFPELPHNALAQVLKQARTRGKVWRARAVDDAERAKLAIRAHIRHRHTDYEQIFGGLACGNAII